MALAVEVASIDAFSVAPTSTLPSVAVACPTFLRNAVMSFLISLRASDRPTETDSEPEVEAETDSAAALETASIAEVSCACRLMSPFCAVTVVAVST